MEIEIEIRGKKFNIDEITNFYTQWDEESKVYHLAVTTEDGQISDFFEEGVEHAFTGELHSMKLIYQKVMGI
jgi:hypothetical protein